MLMLIRAALLGLALPPRSSAHALRAQRSSASSTRTRGFENAPHRRGEASGGNEGYDDTEWNEEEDSTAEELERLVEAGAGEESGDGVNGGAPVDPNAWNPETDQCKVDEYPNPVDDETV